MPKPNGKPTRLAGVLNDIETDKQHHLTGSFLPQTPLAGSRSPTPTTQRKFRVKDDFYESKGFWTDLKTFRWMRVPSTSFVLTMIPVILYRVCWGLSIKQNPFEPMLFVSHPVESSPPDDPRYGKGPLDIVFILYHIVFFSFVRQFAILKCFIPLGRHFGIRKQAKLDRFGEQAYAVLYYGVMGFWGIYVMSKLPTWWYKTEYFWIDYPHWDMNPTLKRYYLMHFSYWIQQLAILAMGLEKPRKDFKELVAHHFVTLWLIGWSYGVNLTLIGNAVYVSMDMPDTIFALSKCFNYLNMTRTKTVTFATTIVVWTYFRHYQSIRILISVLTEFKLVPESANVWSPPDGVWLVWWMRYQIFAPLFLLQLLNLFWYFLIWRVAYRALVGQGLDDERSDDEGDADGDKED